MAVYDLPSSGTSPAGGPALLLVTISHAGITDGPAAPTEGGTLAVAPLADLARPSLDQLHRALTPPRTATLPRPAARRRKGAVA